MFEIHLRTENSCYPIYIGENLTSLLQNFLQQNFRGARVAIVTDDQVKKLHLDPLVRNLKTINIEPIVISLPVGETTKSFFYLEQLLNEILKHHLERNDILIAFGGGVIGDLTGFAASIARRSMNFIQIPTSLLAQIDSSVGGKTGINSPYGKNLIGSFYQPQLVLCDSEYLRTLSDREWVAGYAEMVKYGLIERADFFEFLENNYRRLRIDEAILHEAIKISCETKAHIVSKDEKEKGERALLNLGHSFGHALEAFYQYDPNFIIHGEGVALGMVLAFEFSHQLKLCPEKEVDRIKGHFQAVGLPTKIQDFPPTWPNAEQMLYLMRQDKKTVRGALNLILAHRIGESFIAKNVDTKQLFSFLTQKLPQQ